MGTTPTPITIDGVTYESLAACCRAFGIGPNRLSSHKCRYPEATNEEAIRYLIALKAQGGKVGPAVKKTPSFLKAQALGNFERVLRQKPTPKPLISEADVEAFDAPVVETVVPFPPPVVVASRDVIELRPIQEDNEIKITISIKLPEALRRFLSVA